MVVRQLAAWVDDKRELTIKVRIYRLSYMHFKIEVYRHSDSTDKSTARISDTFHRYLPT